MRRFLVCQSNSRSLLFGILRLFVVAFVFQGVCHALVVPASSAELGKSSIKNPSLSGRDDLSKRMAHVPSVPRIRQKVIEGGQMNNKVSIFWSNFQPPADGYRTAKQWGRYKFDCRAVLYDRALPDAEHRYFAPGTPNDPVTEEQDTQKIQVMSAVFAQTSSRNVYVLLQNGKEFQPGSTWINYEQPSLTAPSSAVTKTFLVRWPSQTQTSIWRRGDGQWGVWPPPGADPSIFAG